MGRTKSSVSFCLWIILVYIMGASAVISNIQECDGGKDCLKCDNITSRCVKCARLIVVGSRLCVDTCPSGYREEWSSLVTYMGRVCREPGFWGLPGRTLAIVVGTFSGAAICMGVLLAGYIYLRSRRHRKPCSGRGHANSIHDLDLDTPDRREFLKHLATLRHEAPVFLAMLNDTRKQVRDLHHTNRANDSSIQAYRPVLRDLVRILTLLNRSEDRILSPPGDWVTLLAWGERVLRRYKKQHPHQVAQAQLVSFLQVPIQTNHQSPPPISREREQQTLTTFQPYNTLTKTATTGTAASTNNNKSFNPNNNASELQELAITTFNCNYNNTPSSGNSNDVVVLRREQPSLIDAGPELNPNWEFHPSNYTILAEWSASRDYLVEDDFITLGFRPQDEITTEL